MAVRQEMSKSFYVAVGRKFNMSTPCKTTFMADDYAPHAITAMLKSFGLESTAGLIEYDLHRILEDGTYVLVSQRFGPDGIKKIKKDTKKDETNEELVDRLVQELAKLDTSQPDTEKKYTPYKLATA